MGHTNHSEADGSSHVKSQSNALSNIWKEDDWLDVARHKTEDSCHTVDGRLKQKSQKPYGLVDKTSFSQIFRQAGLTELD